MSNISLSDACFLTLPELLNIASLECLLNDWEDVISAKNSNCKAIILKGNDKAFCAGFDVRQIISEVNEVSLRSAVCLFSDFLQQLFKAGMVSIALVEGAAIGAGLGIAAACDFIIATEKAVFQIPEAFFSLLPSTIMPYLSTKLSLDKIKKLFITCQSLSVNEACDVGLVDEVLAKDNPDAFLKKFINRKIKCTQQGLTEYKRFMLEHYLQYFDVQARAGVETLLEKTEDAAVKARLRELSIADFIEET